MRTHVHATARFRTLIVRAAALAVSGLPCAGAAAAGPAPGELVDLAPFGTAFAEAASLGIAWENPRDVTEVEAVVPDAADPVAGAGLHLEWWGSVWPKHGSGGWMQLDDPWNGRWVRVPVAAVRGEALGSWRFGIPPLTAEEWGEAGQTDVAYRRTLKVRVVRDGDGMPAGARLRVLGRSRWSQGAYDLAIRLTADGARCGSIEVTNGGLSRAAALSSCAAISPEGAVWTVQGVAGTVGRLRLWLRFAEPPEPGSHDTTRVTVRLGEGAAATGFSFVPQDVSAAGAMRLPDFGIVVADPAATAGAAPDAAAGAPAPAGTVRARVARRPEMTREAALAGIPRLAPAPWVPLGVPSARQEVVVGPNGDWSMWRASLHTPGRDAARAPWRDDKLDAILDTRAEPHFDGGDRDGLTRGLAEGWLPLVETRWRTGPVEFRQRVVATILLGDLGDDTARRGDETVVVLAQLQVANRSEAAASATVHLRYNHPAPIRLQPDGLVTIDAPLPEGAAPDLTPVRCHVLDGAGTAAAGAVQEWSVLPAAAGGQAEGVTLRWQASLAPGQRRAIEVKQAYVDLLTPEELARLREIAFDRELPRILGYWRERLARGMRIDVPDAALNELYAANLWHTLITTDRDPETGLYNQGVATFRYRVFANETVMVARALDLRGEHEEAARYLEPLLHYQGTEPLTGRFSTKEGVFHGAGAYTHGQYSMNHGFALWGIAEHFLLSRDRAYLERVTPQLLAGCEFVIGERQRAMPAPDGPTPPWRGLAPPCSLEDVIEFQHWLATNGYFFLGVKRVADALAAVGHPESARLAEVAEAYRADIERAAREAATRAAAVPLRDGSYIPYVPSRVGQWRHLTEGWIREALYCPLHLATTGVVAADDPLITWMLDELEDNILFSRESGYGVSDVEGDWFARGGVTLQPCLLDLPGTYLARDEIEAALRAFWNAYALLIHPDARCLAEWAPAFGRAGGPLYKTSDEAQFVTWLRDLLVWEEGDRLWFARGAPRAWLEPGRAIRIERAVTYFGETALTIEARPDARAIEAAIAVPGARPPREIWLRLRHPRGARPARVTVDGVQLEADRIVGEDICVWRQASEGAGVPARLAVVCATYPEARSDREWR